MDFQLIEANWLQLSPSATTWKEQVPTPSSAWDLYFGGLISQYRKGENKTQNPLIYTQQAPPLPLAEGTHQPPPATVSPTPWTQGLGPAPEGLEVAWGSQVADSHLQLRPSPAHFGHRLRKQPFRCHGDAESGSFRWAARRRFPAPSSSAPRKRPAWWRHEDGSQ